MSCRDPVVLRRARVRPAQGPGSGSSIQQLLRCVIDLRPKQQKCVVVVVLLLLLLLLRWPPGEDSMAALFSLLLHRSGPPCTAEFDASPLYLCCFYRF